MNYYQTAEPPLGASCVCAHKQNARKEQEVMHEPCGYFRLYGRRSPPFENPSRSGQGKIPTPNLPPVRQTRIMGTHWDVCILHMTTPLHLTHRSTPGPFTTTTQPPLLFYVQRRLGPASRQPYPREPSCQIVITRLL